MAYDRVPEEARVTTSGPEAASTGGVLDRLGHFFRIEVPLEVRDLYPELGPHLSAATVRGLLAALERFGDTGCDAPRLGERTGLGRSELEAALGQLGEDRLVRHRLYRVSRPFGGVDARLSCSITQTGREYLRRAGAGSGS